MFLTLGPVLSSADLTAIHEALDGLSWQDGRHTAGAGAREVKSNRQADLLSEPGQRLHERLSALILAHPVLQAAARPARMSRLLVSRTGPGDSYGVHVDNPFMRAADGLTTLRTDLAFTLFLSPPETYSGGALAIHRPDGIHRHKLNAGDMLVYPAHFLHAVEPVTGGERLVCVGWIESRVRSADAREILFEIDTLRAGLASGHPATPDQRLTLDRIGAALERLVS